MGLRQFGTSLRRLDKHPLGPSKTINAIIKMEERELAIEVLLLNCTGGIFMSGLDRTHVTADIFINFQASILYLIVQSIINILLPMLLYIVFL